MSKAIFNLYKYNLQVEAMAYIRNKNRQAYTWCSLNELLNAPGKDDEKSALWNSMVASCPEWNGVLATIQKRYNGLRNRIIEKCPGISEEAVTKMLYCSIGISAKHGVYYKTNGVYLASVEDWTDFEYWLRANNIRCKSVDDYKYAVKVALASEDMRIGKTDKRGLHIISNRLNNDLNNVLAPFQQRFQFATKDLVEKSANGFLNAKLGEYSHILGLDSVRSYINLEDEGEPKEDDARKEKLNFPNVSKESLEKAFANKPRQLMSTGSKNCLSYSAYKKIFFAFLDAKESPLIMELLKFIDENNINLTPPKFAQDSIIEDKKGELKVEESDESKANKKIIGANSATLFGSVLEARKQNKLENYPALKALLETYKKKNVFDAPMQSMVYEMATKGLSSFKELYDLKVFNTQNQEKISQSNHAIFNEVAKQMVASRNKKLQDLYNAENEKYEKNKKTNPNAVPPQPFQEVTEDQIMQELEDEDSKNGSKTLKQLYRLIRRAQQNLIVTARSGGIGSKEAAQKIAFMSHIPNLENLDKRRGNIGNQINWSLAEYVKPSHINYYKQRIKVLQAVIDMEKNQKTVDDVANQFNAITHRVTMKGSLKPLNKEEKALASKFYDGNKILAWINSFENDKTIKGLLTNEELLKNYNEKLQFLIEKHKNKNFNGFNDFAEVEDLDNIYSYGGGIEGDVLEDDDSKEESDTEDTEDTDDTMNEQLVQENISVGREIDFETGAPTKPFENSFVPKEYTANRKYNVTSASISLIRTVAIEGNVKKNVYRLKTTKKEQEAEKARLAYLVHTNLAKDVQKDPPTKISEEDKVIAKYIEPSADIEVNIKQLESGETEDFVPGQNVPEGDKTEEVEDFVPVQATPPSVEVEKPISEQEQIERTQRIKEQLNKRDNVPVQEPAKQPEQLELNFGVDDITPTRRSAPITNVPAMATPIANAPVSNKRPSSFDAIQKLKDKYRNQGAPAPQASNKSLRTIQSKTIGNLINIAREMDFEGKYKEAEEIHKVIRKYIGK